jgi:desulfoferrodoxin (superoxide reductase-like protein)
MFLIIPSMGTDEPVEVNLIELSIVREKHMPPFAVRFAPEDELHRVAEEVGREEPHLREEAHFVKHEELLRRQRLAESPLQVVKGDRYCA